MEDTIKTNDFVNEKTESKSQKKRKNNQGNLNNEPKKPKTPKPKTEDVKEENKVSDYAIPEKEVEVKPKVEPVLNKGLPNLNKIYFYNYYGNGDLHVGREVVKAMQKLFPTAKCVYAHKRDVKILSDLNLDFIKLEELPGEHCKTDKEWDYDENEKILYCNLWYGACAKRYLNMFSTSIKTIFEVYKNEMDRLFKYKVPGNYQDLIPKIDYSKFPLVKSIDNWIAKYKRGMCVLVINAMPTSGQSDRTNWNQMISELAKSFRTVSFIITNSEYGKVGAPNLVYFRDITGNNGNDLNEIAYLSQFMDIIMNRAQGPNTFCLNQDTFKERRCFINVTNESIYSTAGLDEKAEFITIRDPDIGRIKAIIADKLADYKNTH